MTKLPQLLQGFPWKNSFNNLPAPIKLSSLIGPGVIMLATALGSGEIYFWPGITMKYGFQLIWLALIAIYIQYILNTEFARYTITTGESVVTGFIRLWKPFGWIFLLCCTVPWIWPGWTTGGAKAFSWVFGGDVKIISIISLLIIGLSLSVTKVVYKALELLQKILILGVVIFIALIAIYTVKYESVVALSSGLTTIPTSLPSDLKISTLLSALAFCGAGGSINLAISNWVRDKGLGMGESIPKITNPITSELITTNKTGYFPEATPQNVERWNSWWSLVKKEQIITFFFVGTAGLITLMLISHSLLSGKDLEIGIASLKVEGAEIEKVTNGLLKSNLFYLMVSAVFFTSAIGVLDHVCRLASDIISTMCNIKKSVLSSESKMYFILLWIMIFVGIIILLFFKDNSPQKLLSIAGSLSGVVMFLYSCLILVLNLKLDKETNSDNFKPFRMTLWRKLFICLGILLYGFFSISLIINLF